MKSHYEQIFVRKQIEEAQRQNPFAKLNDLLYECMKEAINDLKIQPGEKLNITEIAKCFEISITPVKNAVVRLVNEGLVEYRGINAGYYVFDVTEKALTDIYDMRKCLEGFAAFLCAQRLILTDTKMLRKLGEEHTRLWVSYAEGDDSIQNYQDREHTDEAFNELLVRYADNEMLYNEYAKNRKNFEYALRRCLDYWKIDRGAYGKKMFAEQHAVIANAIATGIPEIARKSVEDHVQFDKTQCLLRRNRQTVIGFRE